jgi:iron(III) transport system substrate-binding protein
MEKTMNRPFAARGAVLAAALALIALPSVASAQEVNLYTTREAGLIQPLLDAFTKDTKIKVNSIFIKDGLAERVKAEGANSPADVLMTVDIGNLLDTVDQGVTQPVRSEALSSAVPSNLRDKDGHWYALSLRARLVYASKDRVKESAVTYESLADPKWKGRICIRAGQHPYNTALIAAHIVHHGEAKTEAWLKGIKANLARKAGGGDRDVARDILGGICDIGPANSYYVGLMRSGKGGPDQVKWGNAINVLMPTFENGGTHVNISVASVAKHAPNKANAIKLLEFLVSNDAQALYAQANYEYPVRAGAKSDPIIDALGKLNPDKIDLREVAKARKQASMLVDKVGFD